MRYINKNQIVSASVKPKKVREDKIIYEICLLTNDENLSFIIFRDTKEECVALAEKLGLTLID
jgi:replicative superfamily II helicase